MLPYQPTSARAAFVCPGCGRGDGAHPPLCKIAVRLVAAHAARVGGDWRERLRAAAQWYVELYGCRWVTVARHYRAAAADDPPDVDAGEPLEFSPSDWLLIPERQSV